MGMFGNLFRSKTSANPVDFSLIGADMHSHLIPNIDDGSKSLEDSIYLIKCLYDLGYRKLVATPHIMSDYFKNTHDIILNGLETLKDAVEKAGIPMVLEAGAEYMYDDGFLKKVESGNLITFGENYLLIELSPYFPPEKFFDTIFELKTSGINPILAHPERYAYWHESPDIYQSLHDREILLQINIPSLSGYYTPQIKKIAEMLIDKDLVDFVGTDLHNENYYRQLLKAQQSKYLEKLVQSPTLKNRSLLG